nr:MAG TPA: hypothetical protein [Caudoviricetes sp.]
MSSDYTFILLNKRSLVKCLYSLSINIALVVTIHKRISV